DHPISSQANSPLPAPSAEAKSNGQATSPHPAHLKTPRKRGRRLFLRLLALAIVLGGAFGLLLVIGPATGMIRPFRRGHRRGLVLRRVAAERLQLTITERGQLESAENKDVVCRVKARSANSTVATTIRWIIDDGTMVKKGDKLVQLDDSGLYEQLKDQ